MVRMRVQGRSVEEVGPEEPEPGDPGRWDDDEAVPETDSGDPAEAFDALRRRIEAQGAQLGAEMAVIRKGVERAFEEFDRTAAPEDYKPQLAQIVKQLAVIVRHLDAIEKLPVLRHGADYYAQQMKQAGSSLVREAAQKIEGYSADLRQTTRILSDFIEGARARDRQNLSLAVAAIVGLFLGVLLTVTLPSILPGRVVAPWVASVVMGQAPVEAGRAMIQSGDPVRYQRMVWAEWIFANNVEALERCVEDMQQSGQDRQCTVTVKTPVQ